MSFRDALAGMTDAVFDTFGERAEDGSPGARLHPVNGAAAFDVRAILEHGVDRDSPFGGVGVSLVAGDTLVKVPYVDAPELAQNDVVEILAGRDAGRWRIAGSPRRVGRGEKWEAPADRLPFP